MIKALTFLMLSVFSSLAVAAKATPKHARVFAALPALSFEQLGSERTGRIEILNRVTCDPRDAGLCLEMCSALACEWTEPSCRDCFGTGSVVMRSIFTELLPTYAASRTITNQDEIRSLMIGLFTGMMLVVSPASPYDFFNASESPGLRPFLTELCGSENGFIGVLLDEDARPTSAAVAVCFTSRGLIATQLKQNRQENRKTRINNLTGETHVEIVP